MTLGSFRFFPAAVALVASISLSACKTMPEMKDILPIGAGALGALVCYKNVGGGSMRIVTGAACGVGAYLLADWLMKGSAPNEQSRISGEYQRAFNSAPNAPGGALYNIDSRTQEGAVRIVLTLYPKQQIAGANPATECRWFNERIMVNGVQRSDTNRQACHDWNGFSGSEWRMVA